MRKPLAYRVRRIPRSLGQYLRQFTARGALDSTQVLTNIEARKARKLCAGGTMLAPAQVRRKTVEDAQLIAVQSGDPELAWLPRFILRLSNDLRSSLLLAIVQCTEFF